MEENRKKITVDELVRELQDLQKDGLGSVEISLDLNLPYRTRKFHIEGVATSHIYEKDPLDDEYRHTHTGVVLTCYSDVLHC